jgi:hypothetical protein
MERDNYSPYNPRVGWGTGRGLGVDVVAAINRIANCVCAPAAAPLPIAETPVFSPVPGGYELPFVITITSETESASIYYTIDGSDPNASSTLYDPDVPVTITQDTTIKAIAIALGYQNSSIATANYTVEFPQAAAPIFSPAAGNYSVAQSVTIASPNGGTIYYTTDGSTPTTSSFVYSGPIAVAVDTSFRAFAVVPGFDDSAVTNAAYTVTPLVVATPTFSPSTGAFSPTVDVTLSCATSGADIYYTVDGSAPDETDFLYTIPFTLSATTTIKAKAFKASYTASGTATKTYTLTVSGDPVTIYWGSSLNGTVAEGDWDAEFAGPSPTVETYDDWNTLDYFYVYDTTVAAGGTANGPYRYFIMLATGTPPNAAASGGFFTTLNLNTSDMAGAADGYTDTDANGWPCLNVTRVDLTEWRVYRLKNSLNGTVDLRVRAH